MANWRSMLLATTVACASVGFYSAAEAQAVRGRVVDTDTGAAIKGALVTTPSGASTSTGPDGSFVLDTGIDSQITVSAIGYDAKTEAFEKERGFEIRLKQAGELVIVRGIRLGQARALNDQRSASNTVAVQSADEAGRFPDNNVAESLSRLPGVTLVRDQQTGEGQLVTIRGLDSGLNVFTVNGVRLAQTQTDRQIALDTLPTDGYQQLRVSKTSTPDMDGDAIGGTVDLITPTAFDRRGMHYGLAVEGSYQDRGDGRGTKISGNFSNVFGSSENFGVYVSFYAGARDTVSEESENEGEWEPFLWRRDANVAIDENSLFLPGVGLDLYENSLERFGGNFSFDWRPNDATKLYMRGQFGQFDRSVINNGLVVRSIASPRLATPTAPAGSSLWSANGPGGVYAPARMRVDRYFGSREITKAQGFVALGGEWSKDRLDVSGEISQSTGEESNQSYSLEYRADGGLAGTFDDYFLTNGVTFDTSDERFPLWNLAGNGSSLVYDDSLFRFNGGSINNDEITDEKTTAKADIRFRSNKGIFESLGAGIKFVRSSRARDQNRELNASSTEVNLLAPTRSTAAARGLVGADYGSVFNGAYSGNRRFGTLYSPDGVQSFLRGLTSGLEQATITSNRQNDSSGEEDVLAIYGLTKLKHKAWDATIGVRVERTEVENTFWRTDTGTGGVTGNTTSNSDYTNVLPSIHVNYRPNPNIVARGAIWTSISRPEFQNISARESVTRNAQGQITAISRGNPNLKPTESLNFDLGFEWYNQQVGLVQAAIYHKDIKKFIFLNNAVSASSLNPDGVNISQPLNGTSATVSGLEFGVQQQLRFLPSPFDGLGFIFNATLQETEASTGDPTRLPLGRDIIPLINSPDSQANLSIFYEKFGFETRLSYNYSNKYIEDTRDNGVDKWIQAWDRLDFSARYNFKDTGLSISFEAQNLLDSHAYWATKGESSAYQKDYVEAGRSFFLTLTYKH